MDKDHEVAALGASREQIIANIAKLIGPSWGLSWLGLVTQAAWHHRRRFEATNALQPVL